MGKISNNDFKKYIEDNNLESSIEYEQKEDYVAHDLHCACGKDTYRTFNDAKKALKQRGGRSNKKEVYKCNECGYFHLTSKEKQKGHSKKSWERSIHRSKSKSEKSMYCYSEKLLEMEKEKKKKSNHSNHKTSNAKPIPERNQSILNIISDEVINTLKNMKLPSETKEPSRTIYATHHELLEEDLKRNTNILTNNDD